MKMKEVPSLSGQLEWFSLKQKQMNCTLSPSLISRTMEKNAERKALKQMKNCRKNSSLSADVLEVNGVEVADEGDLAHGEFKLELPEGRQDQLEGAEGMWEWIKDGAGPGEGWAGRRDGQVVARHHGDELVYEGLP